MRRTIGLFVATLVLFGLLGCSAAAPEAPAVSTGGSSSGKAAAPTSAPAAAAPRAPSTGNADSASRPAATAAAGSSSSAGAPAEWDRMVIRTANLSLVVKDVEQALGAIRDLTRANNGFTAQSQTQYKGEYMTGTITVQIPAGSYDAVIEQVRKLAVKVESEQSSSQDVTEEYVDLQSDVRNLQASEASLLKLMDQATSVNDILSLQRELTNVRGQIEKLQGRINYLQRRTDMSTLVITLTPEGLASESGVASAWQPLRTVANAWSASIEVVRGLADFLIAVVVFSWWLVPIVALFVWLIRRRRSRRPAAAAVPAPAAPATEPTTGNE